MLAQLCSCNARQNGFVSSSYWIAWLPCSHWSSQSTTATFMTWSNDHKGMLLPCRQGQLVSLFKRTCYNNRSAQGTASLIPPSCAKLTQHNAAAGAASNQPLLTSDVQSLMLLLLLLQGKQDHKPIATTPTNNPKAVLRSHGRPAPHRLFHKNLRELNCPQARMRGGQYTAPQDDAAKQHAKY